MDIGIGDSDSLVPPTTVGDDSLAYTIVSLVSVPFLLANVLVHLIILDKLNLHGLTILSFSFAGLMSYSLLISGHFIYFSDQQPNLDLPNASPERLFVCHAIAISAHFFYLSSYMWLCLMNFDLWMAFRSMKVVGESKHLRKFAKYSIVGWGVPLVTIAVFISIDEFLRNSPGLPLPGYGTFTCFVQPSTRGLYVFIPDGVVHTVNCTLFILLLKILFEARKLRKSTLNTDAGGPSNATKYSAKLFVRLFLVMGGASLVDYLSWNYSTLDINTPRWLVILECISYSYPIALFMIFCLNRRTLAQLGKKYPRLGERVRSTSHCFRKAEASSNPAQPALVDNHLTV